METKVFIVSRDEAMAIRAKYGDEVPVTVTCAKKKSRHKTYYVEETNRVIFFLERFRKKQLKRGGRGA